MMIWLLFIVFIAWVIIIATMECSRRRAFKRGYSKGYDAGLSRKIKFDKMMDVTDLKKNESH